MPGPFSYVNKRDRDRGQRHLRKPRRRQIEFHIERVLNAQRRTVFASSSHSHPRNSFAIQSLLRTAELEAPTKRIVHGVVLNPDSTAISRQILL